MDWQWMAVLLAGCTCIMAGMMMRAPRMECQEDGDGLAPGSAEERMKTDDSRKRGTDALLNDPRIADALQRMEQTVTDARAMANGTFNQGNQGGGDAGRKLPQGFELQHASKDGLQRGDGSRRGFRVW